MKKEHFVLDSEYLETLLVAVPKYVTDIRSQNLFYYSGIYSLPSYLLRTVFVTGIFSKTGSTNTRVLHNLWSPGPRSTFSQIFQDRLYTLISCNMPHSNTLKNHFSHSRKVAEDDDYGLFTVTLFQRVADEFSHKCREEK